MKRKILLLILLVAVADCQRPQVGQFHRSDAQGNFQVNYDAGGGHYLTEDRSFDGSQLLGNYAYKSRDGESVGVAYGSDGAGFVISAPGYLSGTGGRAASGARSSASSFSGQASPAVHQDTGSRFRYQESAAPLASNQPTNWESGSNVVTSHSSLPATEIAAPAASSFDEQRLHHQQEQQLQHQLQLQFQQQLHQQQQAFSSGTQAPTNLAATQPDIQTNQVTTQFASTQQNIHDAFVQPNVHQSAPFTYSFDTYNSLFGLQQPAQFQNQFFQTATPAPPPQQQHFSYQHPTVDQQNPLLEQLLSALRAQQLANAPPPPPPRPAPVVPAPLSFPASPVVAPPVLPVAPVPLSVNQIRPVANLLYLTSRPSAQLLAPTLVSYAFSSPGTDAVPFQFRFPTNPVLF